MNWRTLVTVSFLTFAFSTFGEDQKTITVTVRGLVAKAGKIVLSEPKTELSDAIAKAGGYLSAATTTKVEISRNVDGKFTSFAFDAKDLASGKKKFPLKDGDIIFVPGVIDTLGR